MNRRLTRIHVWFYVPLVVALIFIMSPEKIGESVQDTLFSWILSARSFFSSKKESEVLLQEEEHTTQIALLHQEKVKHQRDLVEEEMSKQLEGIHEFQVAETIFDENPPHGTTLWINVGRSNWHNSAFPLERYCPVLSNGTVLGYIDYVGMSASQVLLLTDPGCLIAVKAKRIGSLKGKLLSSGYHFQKELIRYVQEFQEVPTNLKKSISAVQAILAMLEKNVNQEKNQAYIYLAYGHVQGMPKSKNQAKLHGSGFTCDIDHIDSPKRDLRTGQVTLEEARKSIIQPGDILETSGLDGIFPQGLSVAIVSHVIPLSEGEAFYTVEALPIQENLHSIHSVTLLPRRSNEIMEPRSQIERIISLIEGEEAVQESSSSSITQ